MQDKIEKVYVANKHEEVIIDFLSKFFDPFGYRKSGRSTILAKAYVLIAKRYPKEWITPNDHFYTQRSNQNLLDYIMKEIHMSNQEKDFEFSVNKFRFMVTKEDKTFVDDFNLKREKLP